MTRPATIYDIAKIANTSVATVSRVLSKSTYPVRAELAEKIREIASELNYLPNNIGRQLKTNKSSTIGVIVPSITNPFYASVVSGIEQVATGQGYQVLLCNSQGDPALELKQLTMLYENQVKGVVLSSIAGKNANATLQPYMDRGLKVVSIDQHQPETEAYPIKFDYAKGGKISADYLLDCGHTDIAYLTAPLDRPSRKQILQGYREALLARGVQPVADRIVVSGNPSAGASKIIGEFENGKLLTAQLLRTKPWPTAIFACNDMMAFGAISELHRVGIRVPEEISVIGFDNLEFAEIVTPALTTIEQPKHEMGAIACAKLMEMMSRAEIQSGEIMLQPRLVERGSVRLLT